MSARRILAAALVTLVAVATLTGPGAAAAQTRGSDGRTGPDDRGRADRLAAVRADVRDAATAVETWRTDMDFEPLVSAEDLMFQHGLRLTPGIHVKAWYRLRHGLLWDYCLRGSARGLGLRPGQGVWYDSSLGGLTEGLARPTRTGSACAATAGRPAVGARSGLGIIVPRPYLPVGWRPLPARSGQ